MGGAVWGPKKMPIDLSLFEGHTLKLELIVVASLFIRIKPEYNLRILFWKQSIEEQKFGNYTCGVWPRWLVFWISKFCLGRLCRRLLFVWNSSCRQGARRPGFVCESCVSCSQCKDAADARPIDCHSHCCHIPGLAFCSVPTCPFELEFKIEYFRSILKSTWVLEQTNLSHFGPILFWKIRTKLYGI